MQCRPRRFSDLFSKGTTTIAFQLHEMIPSHFVAWIEIQIWHFLKTKDGGGWGFIRSVSIGMAVLKRLEIDIRIKEDGYFKNLALGMKTCQNPVALSNFRIDH